MGLFGKIVNHIISAWIIGLITNGLVLLVLSVFLAWLGKPPGTFPNLEAIVKDPLSHKDQLTVLPLITGALLKGYISVRS